MAFNLDQVYQTLDGYFFNQFNMGMAEGQTVLRFGQSRFPITTQDYGTANLAIENFSRLVNQIPIDKGNGIVNFSSNNQIDETYYYRLVEPATVTSEDNAAAFGQLKKKASDNYENTCLESTLMPRTQFRPSYAAPTDWYKAGNDIFWTSHSFPVTDPTTPPPGNVINISFYFGKVDINRPWYFGPFVDDKTWYIPGKYEGQLTTFDSKSTNWTLLPVGLIVIKDLVISGQWSSQDIANFKTQFGPFMVTADSGNRLVYAGIQVIGWFLDKMPPLPPIGDDSLPVRSYSLVDQAPSATWTTFPNPPNAVAPPMVVPNIWGQSAMNPQGSANVETVSLEDGRLYKALRTFTMAGPFGAIRGVYPPFTPNDGASFSAHIGFAFGAPPLNATNILFQVIVFTPGSAQTAPNAIVSQFKTINGMLAHVSADLSNYKDQEISIALVVTNQNPSVGAMAYWVDPTVTY